MLFQSSGNRAAARFGIRHAPEAWGENPVSLHAGGVPLNHDFACPIIFRGSINRQLTAAFTYLQRSESIITWMRVLVFGRDPS